MYYLNPEFLFGKQNNGLPLFREELVGEAFTIIPLRYKTSIREYSSNLGLGVSFLVDKGYKPEFESFQINCIKMIYDLSRDFLSIGERLNQSNLFDTYRSSEFRSRFVENSLKGIQVTNSRIESQRIIIFQPRILEARDIISSGLQSNGFHSLDDLITDSRKSKNRKKLTCTPPT